jgi:hypothetical protein
LELYSAEEVKVMHPEKRATILSLFKDVQAGRRHSEDKRALLKALDPAKFSDGSGGQSKRWTPGSDFATTETPYRFYIDGRGFTKIKVAETADEKLGYDPVTHTRTISADEYARREAEAARLKAEADKRLADHLAFLAKDYPESLRKSELPYSDQDDDGDTRAVSHVNAPKPKKPQPQQIADSRAHPMLQIIHNTYDRSS